METPIIVAIISGSVAIVSPISTYVITRMYDRRGLGKIVGRRKALLGTWKGSIVQDTASEMGPMNLEMTFTSSGKVVEGICEIVYPVDNQIIKLKFTGGFYHEQFLKFDYKSPDESIMQFGSAIMTLAPNGRILEGRYVGYGSITNRIVSGAVSMQRIA